MATPSIYIKPTADIFTCQNLPANGTVLQDPSIQIACTGSGQYVPANAAFAFLTERDFYAAGPTGDVAYWLGVTPDPQQASEIFANDEFYYSWGSFVNAYGKWAIEANPALSVPYLEKSRTDRLLTAIPFHLPKTAVCTYTGATGAPYGFAGTSVSESVSTVRVGDHTIESWRFGSTASPDQTNPAQVYDFIKTNISGFPGWSPSGLSGSDADIAFEYNAAEDILQGQAGFIIVGNNKGAATPGSNNFNYAAPQAVVIDSADTKALRLYATIAQKAGLYNVNGVGQYISSFKAASGKWSINMRIPTRDAILGTTEFDNRVVNLKAAYETSSPFGASVKPWSDFTKFGTMPGLVTAPWTFSYSEVNVHRIYTSAFFISQLPQVFDVEATFFISKGTPTVVTLTYTSAGVTLGVGSDVFSFDVPPIPGIFIRPRPNSAVPSWWTSSTTSVNYPTISLLQRATLPTAGTTFLYQLADVQSGQWMLDSVGTGDDQPPEANCTEQLFDVASRTGIPPSTIQLPYQPPNSYYAGLPAVNGGNFEPAGFTGSTEAEWITYANNAYGGAYDPTWVVNSGQPNTVLPMVNTWLGKTGSYVSLSKQTPSPLFYTNNTSAGITLTNSSVLNYLGSLPNEKKSQCTVAPSASTCRLAQWSKTYPNPEIDIEMPSNTLQNAFVATQITDANLLYGFRVEYEGVWHFFRAMNSTVGQRLAPTYGSVLIAEMSMTEATQYSITLPPGTTVVAGTPISNVTLYDSSNAVLQSGLVAYPVAPYITAPSYITRVIVGDKTYVKNGPFTLTASGATFTWTMPVKERPATWNASKPYVAADWNPTTITFTVDQNSLPFQLPSGVNFSDTDPGFQYWAANQAYTSISGTSTSGPIELVVQTVAEYVNKYNTVNLNCYRWTNGGGTGTYCNAWIENFDDEGVPKPVIGGDNDFHTYEIDVDNGPDPKVTFTIDGKQYVNDAFVPGSACRLWCMYEDERGWGGGKGGWAGAMTNLDDLAPVDGSGNVLPFYAYMDIASVSFTPNPRSRDFSIPDAFDQQRTLGGLAYTPYVSYNDQVSNGSAYVNLPSQQKCFSQAAFLPMFQLIPCAPFATPTFPQVGSYAWVTFVKNNTRKDLVLPSGGPGYTDGTYNIGIGSTSNSASFTPAFVASPTGFQSLTGLNGFSLSGSPGDLLGASQPESYKTVYFSVFGIASFPAKPYLIVQSPFYATGLKNQSYWYILEFSATDAIFPDPDNNPSSYIVKDSGGTPYDLLTLIGKMVGICYVAASPYTAPSGFKLPLGNAFRWVPVATTLTPTPDATNYIYFWSTFAGIGCETYGSTNFLSQSSGSDYWRLFDNDSNVLYACVNVLNEPSGTVFPQSSLQDSAAGKTSQLQLSWWPSVSSTASVTELQGYSGTQTPLAAPNIGSVALIFTLTFPLQVLKLGMKIATATTYEVWVMDVELNAVVVAPLTIAVTTTSPTYGNVPKLLGTAPNEVFPVLQAGRLYALCYSVANGFVSPLNATVSPSAWSDPRINICGYGTAQAGSSILIGSEVITTFTGLSTTYLDNPAHSVPVNASLSGVFMDETSQLLPATVVTVQSNSYGWVPTWNADPHFST